MNWLMKALCYFPDKVSPDTEVPFGFTTDRDGSIVPGSVYDNDQREEECPACVLGQATCGYHSRHPATANVSKENANG